jgi:cell wall-associated NlpC family hydrolase
VFTSPTQPYVRALAHRRRPRTGTRSRLLTALAGGVLLPTLAVGAALPAHARESDGAASASSSGNSKANPTDAKHRSGHNHKKHTVKKAAKRAAHRAALKAKHKRQHQRELRVLSRVVKVARNNVGAPYRYGGTSPFGFDCSGFTRFVYSKAAGVSLPHSAHSQSLRGRRIAPTNALPGDLVVTDGGSHVGIYVGKGRFIDAPMPGQVVHARAIYTSNRFFVRING